MLCKPLWTLEVSSETRQSFTCYKVYTQLLPLWIHNYEFLAMMKILQTYKSFRDFVVSIKVSLYFLGLLHAAPI